MRRARAAAAAAAAPAAHGQQPPSANNTSTSTANNTGNATAAPPPPPPPDQLRRTPSGGATAAAAGRRPGVRVTGGGSGGGSASVASSKSRQSSSSRSQQQQQQKQQRRTTKVERRMHNNSNNNNASSASRDLDVASASASSSSFGSQSQTSRSTHSAASASRSARSQQQQQQQQHNTSGTSRTHPGRTRDRVGARANAAAAHSSLPQQQQQQQQQQQAMRPQPSRPGPQSQPLLPSQQQQHHHHHHQQQERKATIAQAPDWLYTSNASGVSGVSALSDSTERTDNRLIGLARRLSADGGSADAYSEEDAAGASNPMPSGTGTGTGTGTGRPIAATRTTTTRSTTSTDNTDGGAVTTEQMMFTIGLNDVATARTTGSNTTSGSANAGDDRRSSFVSVDSSMFSGISGMTGYSEVTQKMDNTMGNTIARRAIAEVERELMIDEEQEEAGIQVAGGSGGGTKSSTVDVLQIAQTLERDESGILTGFDSNDTDASATVQEQPMQKAVQQQQQQHNDLHSSMRMSAVFGRSLGPDAFALGGVEDTIPEEDLSDGHGSASGNDHRSSAGSLQSSVHLERQLRDLHVAQQELRRREEELKREVLVQREVERRRSSEGSGRGGSAVRRNSSRGSKSSIGTSNGPSSPSPPPATATADASGSNKSLGSAARRHSISATASQESLNVDMAPPPGELRRTSSTSNIPNNALMMSGQSLTVGDVGDMQRFEKADEAFADGRDAMQEMDYASAKKAFERALFLYRSCPEEVVEKSVRADIHHALGTIELETGGNDYESALINLRTARRMRATIGDKLGEAMSLKDCARLHATMGQAPNSALNFQECMEIMISELGEENPRVHEFFIDIGATAKQLGMEKDAIEQFEVALDIVRLRRSMKPNDFQTKICLCSVLHSLGILQFHTGDFQQSLKHLQDLMDLRSTIDATPTAQDAGILNLISKIHRKLGNFEMGHTSAKRALDTSRQQRKEAARASHSSGRSLGSLQNSHASEDVSAGVSSGRSSEDPSVYIHLAEDNTIVSELDSTFSPVNAQANQQAPEMRYLPFILVSDECHKKQIRRDTLRANMMKVYFTSSKARREACDILYDVGEMMEFLADDAKQILSSPTSSEKQQMEVMENLLFDGCNVSVSMVDEYAPNAYGIEISDRLFWEGFVMPHDLSEFQSDFVSNSARRQSNPDAMVQNLAHLQSTGRHPLAAIPCVLQLDEDSPMAPHMLVVAFEKAGVGVHAADPDNWPPTSSRVNRYGAGA